MEDQPIVPPHYCPRVCDSNFERPDGNKWEESPSNLIKLVLLLPLTKHRYFCSCSWWKCGGWKQNIAAMVKDPNKPRGKTSSYAFFVQTCREEHKKKHPGTAVNFTEFSKKCSERWKGMSAKEKTKFEDMAKTDKVRYDREMKTYVPPKGVKGGKRKKDPNAPKRPPSAFFIFCSDHRAKIKSENPGISIGDIAKKLGVMWSNVTPKEKTPYEQKALKLKEKYEKEVAAYRAKGVKSDGGKKGGPGRPAGGKKAAPADDDDDDDDDDDEEEDDDEEDDDDDDDDD